MNRYGIKSAYDQRFDDKYFQAGIEALDKLTMDLQDIPMNQGLKYRKRARVSDMVDITEVDSNLKSLLGGFTT